MARWGRSPWPRRFGGGKHTVELEHEAILEALSPYFDVSEDSSVYPEALAQAWAMAVIWCAAGRSRGALIPARMLETLDDWETACRTRPSSSDSVQARRARVASRLRGLIGNTLGDISAALTDLVGSTFVQLQVVPVAGEIVYWPGVNPGPPGLEWSSNRAVLGVQLQQGLLSDDEFAAQRAQVAQLVDAMIPSWMSYRVGTGSSFIVNVGVVGQTFV
ncbi:MAG: DUF2313 domain-containing protein [Betaproteobacteria bacterium]|nr:DUF2313 domain-containing protein [Betaproteobacteria bacterium]